MKPIPFYESLFSRSVPGLLLTIACAVALLFPLANDVILFRISALVGLVLSLFAVLKSLFFKPRPVMVLEEGKFEIRGVKPGAWKLFQRWRVKKIDDECVISIKMGYLRE